jgi:hypothetical protein
METLLNTAFNVGEGAPRPQPVRNEDTRQASYNLMKDQIKSESQQASSNQKFVFGTYTDNNESERKTNWQ